jgi:hypothetical protein
MAFELTWRAGATGGGVPVEWTVQGGFEARNAANAG